MLCNALSEFMLLAIMLLERWRKWKVFIFVAAAAASFERKQRKIPKSHFYSFMIIFYVVLIIPHTLKT